jgi:ATP-dependent exoDNAse (exonuclease V) alpha subunit
MKLTDDQAKAKDNIVKAIENNESHAVLTGQAGTGKTFLTKQLKKHIDDISLITVTHKAKRVLVESIGTSENAMTYAKAMGIKMDINNHGEIIFIPGKEPSILSENYIVDECSMFDQGMINDFETEVKSIAIKPFVLYIGDHHQLPPIDNGGISPLFKRKNVFILNEIIRQDKGNPIRNITSIIADGIDNNKKPLSVLKQFKANFRKDIQQGVIITKERNNVLKTYTYAFKNNVSFGDTNKFAITCFRNNSIWEFNNQIRMYLKLKGEFDEGDIITVTSNVMDDGKLYIQNGEDFWIKEVQTSIIEDIPCWTLSLFRLPNIEREINVVKRTAYSKFKNRKDMFLKDIKLAQGKTKYMVKKEYINFLSNFAYVQHAHALTSYKIQGSTIDTVFADVKDMLNVKPVTDLTKLQSIYVATSRAKNRLVLF